jgi:molybdopterin/thiamine biosynthesis adenylyltransferase
MQAYPSWMRYDRQIAIIGRRAQIALEEAKVLVAGLGGLGSNALGQLAAMGVGQFRLVDPDVVKMSDLHREPLYGEEDVGKPKVKAAKDALKRINPSISVEIYQAPVDESNATKMVDGTDVVVDGLDEIPPRLLLDDASMKAHIPYVFASVQETYGNVSTLIPGVTPRLKYFLKVAGPNPSCCHAVYPPAVFVVASIETAEVISLLIGKTPALAGKLLVYDALTASFDIVPLTPSPPRRTRFVVRLINVQIGYKILTSGLSIPS